MTYASQLHSIADSNVQEYLEGWKRSRAEVANLRERMGQEIDQGKKRAQRDIAEELLAVADNFKALAVHVPGEVEGNAWAQGVLHVARQFEQTLANFGVTSIDPVGQEFDPNLHEAVEQVETPEHASNTVVEVLQQGYVMGDVVLRPAKVKVAT